MKVKLYQDYENLSGLNRGREEIIIANAFILIFSCVATLCLALGVCLSVCLSSAEI